VTAPDTVEVTTRDAAATRRLGERIAGLLRAGDVVVLTGELGAGKTTLTQGIGRGLGVDGQVVSPTFVISRVHAGGRLPLVHVDAYRLGSQAELDDLDLDASVADSVTVVEWGGSLAAALAPDRLEVRLDRDTAPGPGGNEGDEGDGDELRRVTLVASGPRWAGVDLAAAVVATR
jgi:tRNA threonylcarbamoyladenosine biosynthesis protein TsaE